MKLKNKYLIHQFIHIANTQKFKLIILCLVMNAFYGTFVAVQPAMGYGYIGSLLKILKQPYFTLILLSVILLNTMHVYSLFDKNEDYIIRLQTKKQYHKKLISTILFNNFIVYFLELILLFLILNIFYSGNNGIEMLEIGINNLAYSIFYIVRSFLLISLMTIISIYVMEFLNKYLVLIIQLLIYVSIPSGISLWVIKIQGFVFPTYIASYFTSYPYPDFLTEVGSSILFLLLLYVIICILKMIKHRKGTRYEICNTQ